MRTRVMISVVGLLAIGAGACEGRHGGRGDPHERDGGAAGDGGADARGGAGAGGGAGAAGGGAAGDDGAAGAGGAGGGEMCQPAAACSVPGCGNAGPLPGGIALNGVWIGPAGEVWAVGAAGFVGRRDPETSGWCWCAPAPPATLRAVWGASSHEIFAAGDAGTLLRFDGARWVRYPFRVSQSLHALHGTAPENVWAVGEAGAAARFDGSDWRSESADNRYNLGAVWLDETGVVHAAGRAPLPIPDPYVPTFTVEAVFLRHAPGAAGWEVEGSIPQRGGIDVLAMRGTSPANIWAGGINYPSGAAQSYGGLFHFDGAAWTTVTPGAEALSNNSITALAVATPDEDATWFVGTRQGLRFDGSAWREVPELAGATALDARGHEMYAVGADGLVFHWTVAAGWKIDRPASPPAAADAPL